MHVFQGAGVFAHGDGHAAHADGAAVKFADDGFEDARVHFIEAGFVDVAHGQRLLRHLLGHEALGLDLRVVAHPAQQVVGDARRATGAAGDLQRACGFDAHIHQACGADEDVLNLLRRVVVQPVGDAKAGAHGRGEHAGTGGGSHEREGRQIDADGARLGALINDDVQPVVFDGGVQVLLDAGMQAVDFVDEEDVALLQVGQDAGQVSGAVDLRAAGGVQFGAHGVGDEVGQRSLAQAGRAAEQHVVQGFSAHLRSLHHHEQLFFDLGLAVKLREVRRAEGEIKGRVGVVERGIHWQQ